MYGAADYARAREALVRLRRVPGASVMADELCRLIGSLEHPEGLVAVTRAAEALVEEAARG